MGEQTLMKFFAALTLSVLEYDVPVGSFSSDLFTDGEG